jgi:hypothetical protein
MSANVQYMSQHWTKSSWFSLTWASEDERRIGFLWTRGGGGGGTLVLGLCWVTGKSSGRFWYCSPCWGIILYSCCFWEMKTSCCCCFGYLYASCFCWSKIKVFGCCCIGIPMVPSSYPYLRISVVSMGFAGGGQATRFLSFITRIIALLLLIIYSPFKITCMKINLILLDHYCTHT